MSEFEQAVDFVKKIPADGDVKLSNDTRLKFYGWFKQANVGKCSEKGGSRPWAVKMEARAKWDAWNALGDLSADDAKKAYVAELVKVSKDSKTHKFVPKSAIAKPFPNRVQSVATMGTDVDPEGSSVKKVMSKSKSVI